MLTSHGHLERIKLLARPITQFQEILAHLRVLGKNRLGSTSCPVVCGCAKDCTQTLPSLLARPCFVFMELILSLTCTCCYWSYIAYSGHSIFQKKNSVLSSSQLSEIQRQGITSSEKWNLEIEKQNKESIFKILIRRGNGKSFSNFGNHFVILTLNLEMNSTLEHVGPQISSIAGPV